MARHDPQLKLRLSNEMKDHIVSAARENNRSVNAEIVARLQISVDADKLGWKDEGLLSEVLRNLEESAKATQYQSEVLKWMLEQQQTASRLLEHIASTDGRLEPGFLDALRAMLARRGPEAGTFPKHPDDDD